jgi:uncharacterized protein
MMIRPFELAFDIDGVFADTMTLFIDIAEKIYGLSNIRYEDITEYEIESFSGIDKMISTEIIRRILDGDHTSILAPLDGATPVLKRLNRHHRPTLFVTARPSADQIVGWICDMLSVGPADIAVVATGSFDDKAEVLIESDIRYFVEDRLDTCFQLNSAGVTPIVFRQPWNRKPHPFREIGNWQELESMILFE